MGAVPLTTQLGDENRAPGRPATRARRRWGLAWRHSGLLALAAVLVAPGMWMVSASLMTQAEVLSGAILPAVPQWRNYVDIFDRFPFGVFFRNSVLVTGSVVLLNLLFCSMAGYALAKFNFLGKRLVFAFILTTIMIPFTVIAIPLYLVVHQLGWINSYQGLVAPFAVSAFGIFLMRQFMASIRDEYLDAARVDGAGELRIFFVIVLPLARPALMTLAILVFITNWDEFFWPLIAATSDEYRTLPVGLAKLQEAGTSSSTQWHLIMAGATIAVLPIFVLFLAFRRQFMQATSGLAGLNE